MKTTQKSRAGHAHREHGRHVRFKWNNEVSPGVGHALLNGPFHFLAVGHFLSTEPAVITPQ